MAIGTGAAILGGAVIGGVASMSAAGKAAGAQRDAANQANATQRYMYDQTRDDQAPYRELGYSALDRLRERMGLTVANPSSMGMGSGQSGYSPRENAAMGVVSGMMGRPLPGTGKADTGVPWTNNSLRSADDLMSEDPSYQFRLKQGEQGINRSAAAGSGLLSGATMKARARYNQDFASNEFQNSWNRLSSLAGIGQSATNAVGAAGQNYANNVSNNQLAAGNARAAGYIGQANAVNNALGMGINAFQNQQLLSRFPTPNTGSPPPNAMANNWSSDSMLGVNVSPHLNYFD
jgi:hypothetical protein